MQVQQIVEEASEGIRIKEVAISVEVLKAGIVRINSYAVFETMEVVVAVTRGKKEDICYLKLIFQDSKFIDEV